jgi:hypothetical protein
MENRQLFQNLAHMLYVVHDHNLMHLLVPLVSNFEEARCCGLLNRDAAWLVGRVCMGCRAAINDGTTAQCATATMAMLLR